ncbi:MAG TPA: cyanophycin synthetase, partial [Rhodanobacteraceae bacterium]|nr:cyanophycin synthetase [Rhodanobacteraceae bacterium]
AMFGEAQGWHVDTEAICRGNERVFELPGLPLPGAHNARNACAALAAIELLGLHARPAAAALRTFRPLTHRLQRLGMQRGVDWIDDSIATTPAASLAALRSIGDRAATLILGGFDRGLEWDGFARELATRPPHAVIAQGANAPRILEALSRAAVRAHVEPADGLQSAVAHAREVTPPGGVVLLSPGAPSFDSFRDYAERGRTFAALAGFDSAALGEIEGLGIA